MRLRKSYTLEIFILWNRENLGFTFNGQFCTSSFVFDGALDLRSETSFSEDLSKDSRISIPEIIGLAYHGVSQEGVDMAKEEVKKRVAKRNNCQNIRQKVRKEAGLVNKNKSCYW